MLRYNGVLLNNYFLEFQRFIFIASRLRRTFQQVRM